MLNNIQSINHIYFMFHIFSLMPCHCLNIVLFLILDYHKVLDSIFSSPAPKGKGISKVRIYKFGSLDLLQIHIIWSV